MSEENKVEIVNPVENQAEIVTGEISDEEYLNLDMLTSGTARNIVTVRLTTQSGSFCVDVLKKQSLHRILGSDVSKQRQEELAKDNPDNVRLAEITLIEAAEIILDMIKKPALELKDMKLYLGEEELPEDIRDLLLDAIDIVNNPRQTAKAVDTFPSANGNG